MHLVGAIDLGDAGLNGMIATMPQYGKEGSSSYAVSGIQKGFWDSRLRWSFKDFSGEYARYEYSFIQLLHCRVRFNYVFAGKG